jgi:hypothetical protein
MDVRHAIVALNDTTQTDCLPDMGVDVNYYVTFSLQNLSASAVFLGGTGVTVSDYGIKLAAGSTATFEGVSRAFPIFGVSESASASVAIFRVSM